jgi:HK97 family phage portal protein
VAERVTSSGLAVVEHRSLRPPSGSVIPNDNDPADVPPATVGPPEARPGDPNGVEIVSDGPGRPWPPSIIRPSAWSGWPADWATPNWWGQLDALTDIAWSCIDLNSSLLSTMPPYLVDAAPTLQYGWIDNPDPDKYTSWEEFAKQLFWDYHLGEVFVVSTAYYSTGWPARFHVAPPWTVNAELVDGRRQYSIGSLDVTADILHIRYKSSVDDAHGHGPLEAGRARLIAAAMLTRYATNIAASGGIPNSVLKHPDDLGAEQAAELQSQWIEARLSSMGLPAVLSGGVTFETIQLDPEKMALVDLAQWNEARIAILLGVPPFLVGLPSGGDSMTYSNVISLFDYHWRAGLRPKAQAVMAALSGWLLPRDTRVEVNRDAYVQPGPLERAQTDQIFNQIRDDEGNPAMTVEEIRASERLDNSHPTDLAAGVLR